jgi:ribosomal protein L33
MAKPATVKIKLVSSADTGFFYVTKKNHADREAELQEVRSARAQARRLQGSEDQINGGAATAPA